MTKPLDIINYKYIKNNIDLYSTVYKSHIFIIIYYNSKFF